jgi:hypothetical protein
MFGINKLREELEELQGAHSQVVDSINEVREAHKTLSKRLWQVENPPKYKKGDIVNYDKSYGERVLTVCSVKFSDNPDYDTYSGYCSYPKRWEYTLVSNKNDIQDGVWEKFLTPHTPPPAEIKKPSINVEAVASALKGMESNPVPAVDIPTHMAHSESLSVGNFTLNRLVNHKDCFWLERGTETIADNDTFIKNLLDENKEGANLTPADYKQVKELLTVAKELGWQ